MLYFATFLGGSRPKTASGRRRWGCRTWSRCRNVHSRPPHSAWSTQKQKLWLKPRELKHLMTFNPIKYGIRLTDAYAGFTISAKLGGWYSVNGWPTRDCFSRSRFRITRHFGRGAQDDGLAVKIRVITCQFRRKNNPSLSLLHCVRFVIIHNMDFLHVPQVTAAAPLQKRTVTAVWTPVTSGASTTCKFNYSGRWWSQASSESLLDSLVTPCDYNYIVAGDSVNSVWGCCPATESTCDYGVQCAQGTIYDNNNNVDGIWYVVVR